MEHLFPGLEMGPSTRDAFEQAGGPGDGLAELELDAVEALARVCDQPDARVVVPADAAQMGAVVRAVRTGAADGGVIRVDPRRVPTVYKVSPDFAFGRADTVRDGTDVTIMATGLMVAAALVAHERLAEMGVEARVVNMASLRPVDRAAIEAAVRETGAIVTAEEGWKNPGLASAVADVVAAGRPVPMAHLGLEASSSWSGGADALLRHGLTAAHIMGRVHDVMELKAGPQDGAVE